MIAHGITLQEALSRFTVSEPHYEYTRCTIMASVCFFRLCPKCKCEVPAVGSTDYCIDCEDKRRHFQERKRAERAEKAELHVEH